MCQYVVEWPSAAGCPKPPRPSLARATAAIAHPRRAPFLALILLLGAAAARIRSRRSYLRPLWLRMRRGETDAFKQAARAVLPTIPGVTTPKGSAVGRARGNSGVLPAYQAWKPDAMKDV